MRKPSQRKRDGNQIDQMAIIFVLIIKTEGKKKQKTNSLICSSKKKSSVISGTVLKLMVTILMLTMIITLEEKNKAFYLKEYQALIAITLAELLSGENQITIKPAKKQNLSFCA